MEDKLFTAFEILHIHRSIHFFLKQLWLPGEGSVAKTRVKPPTCSPPSSILNIAKTWGRVLSEVHCSPSGKGAGVIGILAVGSLKIGSTAYLEEASDENEHRLRDQLSHKTPCATHFILEFFFIIHQIFLLSRECVTGNHSGKYFLIRS